MFCECVDTQSLPFIRCLLVEDGAVLFEEGGIGVAGKIIAVHVNSEGGEITKAETAVGADIRGENIFIPRYAHCGFLIFACQRYVQPILQYHGSAGREYHQVFVEEAK